MFKKTGSGSVFGLALKGFGPKGLRSLVFTLFLIGLLSMVHGLLSSPAWGATTLDDLSKDMTSIKIDLAGLKSDMGALKDDFGNLRGIVVGLFCAVAGMLAGLFYFVFNISVSLRVPKEERVSKLEVDMVKVKDYLAQVVEKLHLPPIPKSVLVFPLLVVSCLLLVNGAQAVTTLDNSLSEGLQRVQISLAEMKGKVDILLMLYGVYAAALVGMVWALINLSKEVRIPKEERVSKLEVDMVKVKDYLAQVVEKLHLPPIPKSVLIFLVGLSLVSCFWLSPAWGTATLDDLSKDMTSIKVELAGLKSEVKASLSYLDWKINFLILGFFATFGYIVFLTKEIRNPKEERVSKLEVFMEKVQDHLKQIDEKLHLPGIPKSVLLFLVGLFLVSQSAFAVPMMINVQGRLTDASGEAITTARKLVFDLYSSPTSRTSLWNYGVNPVTPNQNGVFNVIIGSAAITAPEFTSTTGSYYLGITVDDAVGVGSDVEMAPRQQLVSVPFAITAKNLREGDAQVKSLTLYASKESSMVRKRGNLYFNDDTARMQYYSGTQWVSLDPPFTSNEYILAFLNELDVVSDLSVTRSIFVPSRDAVLVGVNCQIRATDVGASGSRWVELNLTQGTQTKISFIVPNTGTSNSFTYSFPFPIRVTAGAPVNVNLIRKANTALPGDDRALTWGAHIDMFGLNYIYLPL